MHIDANKLSSEPASEFNLCIIGAGAAGITIAREFLATKYSVCLLEGGGLTPDSRSQEIYSGPASGTVIGEESSYLTTSRLRYLGGTTNHWAGWCRPLDAGDFRERSWVSDSGWPISKNTLNPFYDRACKVVEIPTFHYQVRDLKIPPLLYPNPTIQTKFFHFSPPTRFGTKYREELMQSKNITLFSNANVLSIETSESGESVSHLAVAAFSKKHFSIKAKNFVLATGGIENARLLLASRSTQPQGLGNAHDLVGRYFIDHPHTFAGEIIFTDTTSSREMYKRHIHQTTDQATMGVFCTSFAAQQANQLLNFSTEIRRPGRRRSSRLSKRIAKMVSRTDLQDIEKVRRRELHIRSEQSPNPDSRVLLLQERDEFGSPKAKLHWQLRQQDLDSMRKSIVLLADEVGKQSKGRVRLLIEDDWPRTSGGSHHIGTTRMHASPKKGVVDPNCLVHGMQNLHVAGSSVFPTSGFANPTLSLVALSCRLSDHLKQRLK